MKSRSSRPWRAASGLLARFVILRLQPKNLADFYRKVWAQGRAGSSVPLDVLQEQEVRHLDVKSINRLDHLKLKSTL